MATVDVRCDHSKSVDVPSTILPVLVINHAIEDDEVLFQPESPPSLTASSVGTPPTPEHSKFVWADRKIDQMSEKREAEPTTTEMTLDSFTLSQSAELTSKSVDPSSDISDYPTSLDRSFSMVSTLVEDGDHEERVSMFSMPSAYGPTHPLNATIQAVKEKTQKVVNQPREALSRFQLKGGLVGWLHGDGDDPQPVDIRSSVDEKPIAPSNDSAANELHTPPKQRASSLFSNLRDKVKQTQEQLELKLQALEESTSDHHIICSKQRSRLSGPRLSLQPQPQRSVDLDAEINVGFDDFVSSVSESAPQMPSKSVFRRDSRLRSASSSDGYEKPLSKSSGGVRSRLRSLSFATRTTKTPLQDVDPTSSQLSSSALQWDAFPLEECLADPKLAAEFINTVMPGEEWLLTLLYSIEEYEVLTTAPSPSSGDATPALDVQVTMAITIIDRFLTSPVCVRYSQLEGMGKEARALVGRYNSPHQAVQPEGMAALIAAQGATLPMNLFDHVYAYVFDKLRAAYDSKFRLTREYIRLLALQKQQQLGDEKTLQHLVLTFDQVIESEWCCTVFWVYLFRTSHHHRLSFIMEVKFKLRRLHLAAQEALPSSLEAIQASRRLQHEILLICRRFLDNKIASLVLPTTSPMLQRLRDELLRDAAGLEETMTPDIHIMQLMIEKLDAMRTQTRIDFKRMSFERFTSFLTSALYRDFIVHPGSAQSTQCTRADDLTQLLRNNRIAFHQTPVIPPQARDLAALHTTEQEGCLFPKTVATVFAFHGTLHEGRNDFGFTFHSLFVSPLEEDSAGSSLQKKVECFLVPEGLKSTDVTTACFNFLAGSGENTIYGALWRRGAVGEEGEGRTPKHVQGVCILSRYPLVDGLRSYLRSLASTWTQENSGASDLFATITDHSQASCMLDLARKAFASHCSQLLPTSLSPPTNGVVLDTTCQDLFECLSITNVMRVFSLILQEKKIVLVASSYSVLVSVGETLRSIVSPLVWNHIYVPVLPMTMKGYLHCPTSFIFGLHSSYVRQSELPKPSEELAVVNLDRDSVTGGGDVYMPPLRANVLREKLTILCKPRLRTRDHIDFSPSESLILPFPSHAIRCAFHHELVDILRHLETFAFRFACADRTVSVVDTSNKSRLWPLDTVRFYTAILQSQAFSTYLGCR